MKFPGTLKVVPTGTKLPIILFKNLTTDKEHAVVCEDMATAKDKLAELKSLSHIEIVWRGKGQAIISNPNKEV